MVNDWNNVGKTMPLAPAMTGNGTLIPHKNGDDWGMVYYCFTHIKLHWEHVINL